MASCLIHLPGWLYRLALELCAQTPRGASTAVGRAGPSCRPLRNLRLPEYHRPPIRRAPRYGLLPDLVVPTAGFPYGRYACSYIAIDSGEWSLTRLCWGALGYGRTGWLALRCWVAARPSGWPSLVSVETGTGAQENKLSENEKVTRIYCTLGKLEPRKGPGRITPALSPSIRVGRDSDATGRELRKPCCRLGLLQRPS